MPQVRTMAGSGNCLQLHELPVAFARLHLQRIHYSCLRWFPLFFWINLALAFCCIHDRIYTVYISPESAQKYG